MSYTEVLGFKKGEVVALKEYKNSHGSAAMIWTALWDKYVRTPGMAKWDTWLTGDHSKLWALAGDNRLSQMEKKVLEATFDNYVVRIEDAKKLASYFEEFERRYGHPERVCHLGDMAQDMREAVDSGEYIALGWYWTSTTDFPWKTYPECETCGQELEESEDYDITAEGGKHVYMVME